MEQDTSVNPVNKSTVQFEILEATSKDAESLIELRRTLYNETDLLLFEPTEYRPTVESETAFITAFEKSNNSALFIAVVDNLDLVGFMGVAGGTTNRTAHKATVFMGVLKKYWGQGIGKKLFDNLFQWLEVTSLSRLELTTAVHNERAYSLYKAVGFETECVKKNNVLVDGKHVDEYQMCYLLPQANNR
ncbi:MAG: GNAT family N-acetyltransferase [Candidatus Thiodiazotropha sp.]